MSTGFLSRRTFTAGSFAAGLTAGSAARAQEHAPTGGTLTATWGGGEPQSCYVPSGGGYAPTLTSSKLFERLARRNMDGSFTGMLAERWAPSDDFKTYTITRAAGRALARRQATDGRRRPVQHHRAVAKVRDRAGDARPRRRRGPDPTP